MNASSSAATAIFVHHEFSVPWNVIAVWMIPKSALLGTSPTLPHAAGQQRAAHDHGCDRIELQPGPAVALPDWL